MARPSSNRRWSAFNIVAIGIGLLAAVTIIGPIVGMILRLILEGGENPFAQALALPGIGEVLVNTAIIVVVAMPFGLIIGSLFAWLNERTNARMGWLSRALPVIPLMLPPIAAAIGWVFLLSPRAGTLNVALRSMFGIESGEGPLNIFTWPGLLFLYIVELVPVVYLVVSAALRNVDPALEQAARIAGAGPLKTVARITLPAVKPALAAAGWLAVTICLGLFSVPSIIGGTAGIPVLSTTIMNLLNKSYPPQTQVAVVLGLVLLFAIGLAWMVQRLIVRGGRFASVGGKGMRAARIDLGAWRWPARVLMLLFLTVASVLPIVGLLLVSVQRFWSATVDWSTITFDNYIAVLFKNVQTQAAIGNSLRLALMGATIAVIVSVLVAIVARQRPGWLTTSVNAVLKLPSTFSHIIVALAVLLAFAGAPFWLSGTVWIILIAYLVLYLPQASIASEAAVLQVDKQLVEAAHTSGAGDVRTNLRVLLPLVLPGLASGWALVFVYMAGDLTASVLLSGTRSPTIGYMILTQYENGTYPTIAALSVIVTIVFSVVVLTMLRLTRGRFSAG
ncbi:MAG: iron ABC transporter permease [Aeromicrobium sp.]